MGEEKRIFSKVIEAEKENSAIEKLKSLFGSNHKVKRHMIKIEKVEKVE